MNKVEQALWDDADTALAPFRPNDPGKHIQTCVPTPEWKNIAKACADRGISLSLFLRIAARQHLAWLGAWRCPFEAAAEDETT